MLLQTVFVILIYYLKNTHYLEQWITHPLIYIFILDYALIIYK